MEKIQNQLAKIKDLLDVPFFKVLLFLLIGVVLYSAMYNHVKPEKVDLNLFSVAEKTIRSPITVEDKASTEEKRKEAIDSVQDVYILKKEYTENRVDLVTSIFDSILEVQKETTEAINQAEKETTELDKEQFTVAQQLTILKGKLTESVTKDISDTVFLALLKSSKEDLAIAKDLTVTAINNVMRLRISADDVENSKKKLEEELKFTSLNNDLRNAAIELGRYAVIQNEFYDPNATEELRQQALEGVEPVKILQGQILVEEGQLISREIYSQLELVGLLDNENSIKPFIGLAIMILVLLGGIYYYFHVLDVTSELKQSYMLIFSLLFILSISIMKLISLFNQFKFTEIGYLFPAAMGAMLIKFLINEKVAIAFSVMMAICGSIIFNEGIAGTLQVTMAIYLLISGLASVLFLGSSNRRTKILQAGLLVAVINILVILSLMFLRNGQYSGIEYGFYFICALVSGIGSAVLAIGILPFFEAGFGILSTMKLIELSNPNHPLLRKILTEAPGTYHHSIMVANLAESACEAIGANGLLARVGCYYHDIGKTKRPHFFIENQLNVDNPHDRIPPQTSKNIIIAHVLDGSQILRKYKMPKEIIDIAEQHHGTTLLQYFVHKAKQAEIEVNEADFRYPGPKAKSKESAIVGIADSVEAAVRSMVHPTPDQIESLVRKIIADRLQDDQLSECDITLKELEIVTHSLCETLKGIFHSRIEYPEISKQKVNEA
jgi:cyclic-di-AMP phosphodiesterase PgpH